MGGRIDEPRVFHAPDRVVMIVAVAAAVALQPDISIVDVRMPPSHTDEGLRAAVEVRSARPGLPISIGSLPFFDQFAAIRGPKDMRIAVTGAYGFSGKYIARRLLDLKHDVITLTNSPHRGNPFGELVKVIISPRRRNSKTHCAASRF